MAGFEFDRFRIDVATRQLFKDGVAVPLPARVFETLLVLVTHHPRLVGKEELVQAVWAGTSVSDDSIIQNISILRRALGDDPNQPRYVATIARHGYRFIPSPTPLVPPQAVAPEAGRVAPRRSSLAVAAALAFVAGAIVAFLAGRAGQDRLGDAASGSLRFEERLPPGKELSGPAAISPDGRSLAYTARNEDGVARIWLRRLDAPDAQPLPGTETALMPFWSPDGKYVGFRTPSAVKRVDLSTGTVRVMADLTVAGSAPGATWARGDVILYSHLGKLLSVPASGSDPQIVVDAEAGQLAELRWPVALPDGRHFLFFATGANAERSGTYLGTLGSPQTTLLLPGVRATYAAPDYLLHVGADGLVAQRFSVASARIEGPPMTIPGHVMSTARISAGASGVLAITQETWSERLAWFDRRGNRLDTIDVPRSLVSVRLSPDDRYALAVTNEDEVREVWLLDLVRNVSSRLLRNATGPTWAPDSSRFVFAAINGTGSDLHLGTIGGLPAQDVSWLRTDEVKVANSWSPDGRFVVFTKFTNVDQTSQDLWLLPTAGDRAPVPFLQTRARESGGIVSPDGRWIAYVSDETGAPEIYVQSFPTAGSKTRISTGGGAQPIWRGDGRELFYLSESQQLMAVPIQPGPDPRPGTAQLLFSSDPAVMSITGFAAGADGQRFLVVTRRTEGRVSILTNWEATLGP